MAKSSMPPELQDLADQVGEFIQYWGFKKIHGRIWSHLFLSDVPLDASELIGRLSVSKALISMSLKDLLKYHVIEECTHKSARGTQQYQANQAVMDVILHVLRTREKRMIARIQGAHRLLKELPAQELTQIRVNPKAVKILGELVGKAAESLDAIIALNTLELKDLQKYSQGVEFGED